MLGYQLTLGNFRDSAWSLGMCEDAMPENLQSSGTYVLALLKGKAC